jgi:hypothetical protein
MKKFKVAMKREILVYLVMLFVLSLVMHSDLLSDPFSRFQLMQEKENYSHPFLYTFFVYSILFIIRKVLDFIIGLFDKNTH